MRLRGLIPAGLVVALLGSVTTAPGQALAADPAGQMPHVIVLEKDGPVPLPVGQSGSIATMHLPRGRWAILAKLNPVMTGYAGLGFVRCSLVAGGDVDRSEHTIYSPDATASRLVLGLQISHVFWRTVGGTARLRCESSIEEVEARFIRITAVKAGRLTRIDLGSGTRTTNGSGVPEVVSAWRNEPVPVRAEEFGRVARVHLPHGSWVVFAKLDVARSTGGDQIPTTSDLTCRLAAGADFDKIELRVGHGPPPEDRPIPLLNVVHTFESANGGPVAVLCKRVGAPLDASFVHLTAIRAGRLVEMPLRSTEGGGIPRIVSGRRDGPVPLPVSDEYIAVARLRLPRGSWLVLAKAYVGRDIGAGEDYIRCRLVAGDDRDEVNLYTNDREGVAFHLPHRFTSDGGGAVVMRCRSGPPADPLPSRLLGDSGNDVRFIRFTAIRAGTLSVRRV